MSRKRKADAEPVSAVNQKRNDTLVTASKSARSALFAQQDDPQLVSKRRLLPPHDSDVASSELRASDDALNYVSDASTSDEEDALEGIGRSGLNGSGAEVERPLLNESQYPTSWKRSRELIVGEILAHSPSSARIVVTGSSNSGKHTYSQYLLKALLHPPKELNLTPARAVAVLYVDPSNGASGLPGHVSVQVVDSKKDLDAYDLPVEMLKYRHIPVGLFGHKEDPQHFLAAVGELVHEVQRLNMTMPLIASLPPVERETERGMVTQVLRSLVQLLEAEHICFLHHGSQHTLDTMEVLSATKKQDAALWEMENLLDSRLVPAVPAASKRGKALWSYFHGTPTETEALSMSSYKPYAISYEFESMDTSTDIAGCLVLGDLPLNHPFMMSRLLNGSIVAIVECQDSALDCMAVAEGDEIPYCADAEFGILLHARGLGYGLIRSIAHERKLLHVITPHTVAKRLNETDHEKILLVYGVADSPGWAYREDLYAGLDASYLGRARKGMQAVRSRRFKKKA